MKFLFVLGLMILAISCKTHITNSNESKAKPYVAPIITHEEYDCVISTKERLYFHNDSTKIASLKLEGTTCGAYGYTLNDTVCCNINPIEFERNPNAEGKIDLGKLSPGMHLLVIWNGRNKKIFNIPVTVGF
jgi:hypothetical protein